MTYRINGVSISEEEFKALPSKLDFSAKGSPYGYDADKLLADGVMCPADGKRYTSRREWNDTLRARGYEEVGNEKQPKQAIQGDFNVHSELKAAIQQHLR